MTVRRVDPRLQRHSQPEDHGRVRRSAGTAIFRRFEPCSRSSDHIRTPDSVCARQRRSSTWWRCSASRMPSHRRAL